MELTASVNIISQTRMRNAAGADATATPSLRDCWIPGLGASDRRVLEQLDGVS